MTQNSPSLDVRYCPLHSHVLFEPKFGLETGSFEGPCAILHHTATRVWVSASYCDLPFQTQIDAVLVTDGVESYSFDGSCIVSVHAKHVSRYLLEDEADAIAACMKADADLYSCAVG